MAENDADLIDLGEFIKQCKARGRDPSFSGYEPYQELFDQGIIPPGTLIEVREGLVDRFYLVRKGDGWLDSVVERGTFYDPRQLLSSDLNPGGWSIKNYKLSDPIKH